MRHALSSDHRISSMNLVIFFRTAKEDFQRRGKDDEAFVFEMLEDHFRETQSTSYDSRIFGL